MDNETDRPSAWEETGAVIRPAAWGERSTPLSTSFERPKAVTPTDFAKHVSPLLTLVAPTGMTQDERKGWMHAAFSALGDVNAGDLERAVSAAMRTVDHPSKIVPAIRAELGRSYQPTSTIIPQRYLPEPPREVVPFEETQAILKRVRAKYASQSDDAA